MITNSVLENLDTPVSSASVDIKELFSGGDNTERINLDPGEYIINIPGFGSADGGDPVLLIVSDYSVEVSGLGLNKVSKEDLFGDHPYFDNEKYRAKARLLGLEGVTFVMSKNVKINSLVNSCGHNYYFDWIYEPMYCDDDIVYEAVCKYMFYNHFEYLLHNKNERDLEYIFKFIDYSKWFESYNESGNKISYDVVGDKRFIVEII